MGCDEGFDFYPSLNESEMPQWNLFLDAVRAKYKSDSLFKETNDYIEFTVGEHPKLNINGMDFRRFSSRTNGRSGVEKYINGIALIAKDFFPPIKFGYKTIPRIHHWTEWGLNEGYDQDIIYEWTEIWNPTDKFQYK